MTHLSHRCAADFFEPSKKPPILELIIEMTIFNINNDYVKTLKVGANFKKKNIGF